jgi:ESS family glutamate:Na+ symporter
LSKSASLITTKISLPVFSCAFIAGIVINYIINKTSISFYVDKKTINKLSGTFTDLLVAFGISSIKLPIVIKYAMPLTVLFLFGIAYCLVLFLWLTPRMMNKYWYERAVFTWGWMTGTMAMGIALLRIIDPKLKSKTLDDFAFAYLPIAPIEILVVSVSPMMFFSGKGWHFVAACVGYGLAVWIFAGINGWFHWKPYPKEAIFVKED